MNPGYLVVPPQPVDMFHGVLCRVGLRWCLPERVVTPLGSGWRCRACKKTAATAGELVGIDDAVWAPGEAA